MADSKSIEDFINASCTHIALLDEDYRPVTNILPIPKDGSGVTFDPAERDGVALFIGYFNDDHQFVAWVDLPSGADAYHWPGVTVQEG